MRIVNREEFLKMPAGTVYHKYDQLGIYGSLCAKWDSGGLTNDWNYMELTGCIDTKDGQDLMDALFEVEDGRDYEFHLNVIQRDGFYDQDQLFSIYDTKDLNRPIFKLIEIRDGMMLKPIENQG